MMEPLRVTAFAKIAWLGSSDQSTAKNFPLCRPGLKIQLSALAIGVRSSTAVEEQVSIVYSMISLIDIGLHEGDK
jgi:hypothetical protein